MADKVKYKRLEIVADNVYASGDLHGSIGSLIMKIRSCEIKDSVIICCGDVGFGFEKEGSYNRILTKLNKLCKDNNVHVIFIRGNHDNPNYFTGKKINRSNVKAVADYTVVTVIDSKSTLVRNNILCVGGAISIDRTYRLSVMERERMTLKLYKGNSEGLHECYWSDEPPVYENAILSLITADRVMVDTVCTHTCPSFCDPMTKDGIRTWMRYDENLENDINNERAVMDSIHGKLVSDNHPLTQWMYGHYHRYSNQLIDDIRYVMVDMERGGNVMLVDIFERKGMYS